MVDIKTVYNALSKVAYDFPVPIVELLQIQTKDPFRVLVGTILSARTKDETTAKVLPKLFSKVKMASDFRGLSLSQIEKLIYPVGFYKTKAKHLKLLPDVLDERYQGEIPSTVEELIELPGVGRKTANLVVAVAFQKPAICVDVHMHRIMNRLGYIKTKNPLETEMVLRKKLPVEYWTTISGLIVAYGQHICRPISPKCSECIIRKECKRVGVTTSR
ncbi:MAG: endonuclease III [Nanoarchaeota archaeon]|nr:endonuclease III [Nanoarchaeota archaeon]